MTIVAPWVVRILLEGEERDPNRVTLAGDVSDAAVNISLDDLDALNVALVRETTQLTDVSLWFRPDTSPKDSAGREYPDR
jgi:hypothetical protein